MIPTNLPQREYIQGLWQFEDNFNDSSANGNNLTETSGTIPFVTGKIGKAADFEAGDTEYLAITDAVQTGLDITGEITIACWVKPETIIADGGFIAGKVHTVNKIAYRLYHYNGNLIWKLSSDGTNESTLQVDGALSAGNWTHIVTTLNQTDDKMYMYLDGSSSGSPVSFTGNIYNNDQPFVIGALNVTGTPIYFFDGLIDEVIIWNKALTADEAAIVYNISAYSYFIPQIIMF